MSENTYIVYVKTDEQGRITAVDSSYNNADFAGWAQIDEGTEYKHSHAMSSYFDRPYTSGGIPRYKLVDGAPVLRTTEEIEADRASLPEPEAPLTWSTLAACLYFHQPLHDRGLLHGRGRDLSLHH